MTECVSIRVHVMNIKFITGASTSTRILQSKLTDIPIMGCYNLQLQIHNFLSQTCALVVLWKFLERVPSLVAGVWLTQLGSSIFFFSQSTHHCHLVAHLYIHIHAYVFYIHVTMRCHTSKKYAQHRSANGEEEESS